MSYLFLVFLLSFLNYTEQKRADFCSDLPKLDVVPGTAWDILTNSDTKHLTDISYDKCRKTSDGKYVIPDNTQEIGIENHNEFEISAEIIERWTDYTAPTATEFTKPIEKWHRDFLPLFYTFSDEYQELKSTQIKLHAFTCRSQLRKVLYRLRATSDVLSASVTSRFTEIFDAIREQRMDKAKNLLRTIVNEYGTHYTTQIDVGSMIVMEDYLEKAFLQLHNNTRDQIVKESKLSFTQAFPSANVTRQEKVEADLYDEYNQAIVTTRLRLYGEVSLEKKDEELDIVAIGRSYTSLTGLITESNFANVSQAILSKCKQMLNDTIKDYFGLNVHRGCTNPDSPNFEYIANLDDGSCEPTTDTYIFGGIYQTCTKQANAYVDDACVNDFVNNSLTNDVNCPTGFTSVPLFSQYFPYRYDIPTAKFWTFDYVHLSVFACMANSTDVMLTSHFGGFYSKSLGIDNVVTKSQNCPPFYTNLQVLNDNLEVCVSHNERARQQLLNFGGFATCSNEFSCPNGYEKHLAIEIDSDKVYYCLKDISSKEYDVVPIVNRFEFDNLTELMEFKNEITVTETETEVTETEVTETEVNEIEDNEIAHFKSLATKVEHSCIVYAIIFCFFCTFFN